MLLAGGLALMLIKAPSATGVAFIALLGAVFMAFPVISATALGGEDLSVLGMSSPSITPVDASCVEWR